MLLLITHYWAHRKTRHRFIAIATLSALLGLTLTSHYDNESHERLLSNVAHIYGDSLTQLAANQSSTATFENDPISLQAGIRNIVDKHAVTSIIVYDIENHILAQVSSKPSASLVDIQDFTAPIIASNNVVGSITLSIAPSLLSTPKDNDFTIITAVVLLLLFMISATELYLLKRKELKGAATDTTPHMLPLLPKEADADNSQNTPSNVTSQDTTVTRPQNASDNIYLFLHIKNIHTLYQQLNGESRKQQIKALEQHIQQAISLYNGDIIATSDDGIVLVFSEGKTDNIYNALYTGEIVLKLNQQAEQSMLVLNAFIQNTNDTTPFIDSLDATRRGTQGKQHQLFIDNSFVSNYHLDSHLDTDTLAKTSLAMVKSFKGSYATLLDNQLRQLLNTL